MLYVLVCLSLKKLVHLFMLHCIVSGVVVTLCSYSAGNNFTLETTGGESFIDPQ